MKCRPFESGLHPSSSSSGAPRPSSAAATRPPFHGRAIAVETDLTSFASLATQTRARAVLMPQAMYATNAALFDAMVTTAGTRLITFASETIAAEPLAALILGAVEHNGPDTGKNRRAVLASLRSEWLPVPCPGVIEGPVRRFGGA